MLLYRRSLRPSYLGNLTENYIKVLEECILEYCANYFVSSDRKTPASPVPSLSLKLFINCDKSVCNQV